MRKNINQISFFPLFFFLSFSLYLLITYMVLEQRWDAWACFSFYWTKRSKKEENQFLVRTSFWCSSSDTYQVTWIASSILSDEIISICSSTCILLLPLVWCAKDRQPLRKGWYHCVSKDFRIRLRCWLWAKIWSCYLILVDYDRLLGLVKKWWFCLVKSFIQCCELVILFGFVVFVCWTPRGSLLSWSS